MSTSARPVVDHVSPPRVVTPLSPGKPTISEGIPGGMPTTTAEIGGMMIGTDCACTGAAPTAAHATSPATRPTPQRRRERLGIENILSLSRALAGLTCAITAA